MDPVEQPASPATVSHAFSERGLTVEEAIDAAEPIVMRAAVWERRRLAVRAAILSALRFAMNLRKPQTSPTLASGVGDHLALGWRSLVVVFGGMFLLLVALPLALIGVVNYMVLATRSRADDVGVSFVVEAVRLHTIDKLGARTALESAARGVRATPLPSLSDVFHIEYLDRPK